MTGAPNAARWREPTEGRERWKPAGGETRAASLDAEHDSAAGFAGDAPVNGRCEWQIGRCTQPNRSEMVRAIDLNALQPVIVAKYGTDAVAEAFVYLDFRHMASNTGRLTPSLSAVKVPTLDDGGVSFWVASSRPCR